jgi:N-glycosylase/DNA lyase
MREQVLLEYLIAGLSSDMAACRLDVPSFQIELRPAEIWKQKVFCVLSSQFNARRAATIADYLVRQVPFFDASLDWSQIEHSCFAFLSSPAVGYRFPKLRARQISQCWFPFAQVKDNYHEYVRSFDSEGYAREEIVEKFPGIGLKQASMFLRNIGASRNLSVIDVHVLFYLRVCHDWRVSHLTSRRYLEAEDILRDDAAHYGMDLNVFDTVVWTAARTLKKAAHHV